MVTSKETLQCWYIAETLVHAHPEYLWRPYVRGHPCGTPWVSIVRELQLILDGPESLSIYRVNQPLWLSMGTLYPTRSMTELTDMLEMTYTMVLIYDWMVVSWSRHLLEERARLRWLPGYTPPDFKAEAISFLSHQVLDRDQGIRNVVGAVVAFGHNNGLIHEDLD